MKLDCYISVNNGVRMPMILYGTAWKKERTSALVEQAIRCGFRGIDTACQPKHYNEAGVGEGVSACIDKGLIDRSGLYLQTKFTPLDGQDPERIPYDPSASLSEQVRQSCQVSLTNLQTDYLDCLLLHSPLSSQQKTHLVWRAMEQLVEEGKVKQLGISNCYDLNVLKTLVSFAQNKPAVIQNRFYAATAYDRAIRAYCQDYAIIYQSFWTLSANPQVLNDSNLTSIATYHKRSPAQILFRYLTQYGIVPLTGTTSITHMKEDLAIFDFELNADECGLIKALL